MTAKLTRVALDALAKTMGGDWGLSPDDQLINTAARLIRERNEDSVNDPLVGLFVHTMRDGKIHQQGRIEFVRCDCVMIQFFSWLDGGPTNKEGHLLRELVNGGNRFYDDEEDWRRAGDESMRLRIDDSRRKTQPKESE